MPVKVLNFSEINKTLHDKGVSPLDLLVKKRGSAYVVAVTREKCPSCEKQKPVFEKLSNKMKEKHGSQVEFIRVHAWFSKEETKEAKQTANAFRTVGFPTYIIALKDNHGHSIETYRALRLLASEVEKNIKTAVEIAAWFASKKK